MTADLVDFGPDIAAGDLFSLPPETGVQVLARDPFRSGIATTSSGELKRYAPVDVLSPFPNCDMADRLHGNTHVEPVDINVAMIPHGTLLGERAVVTHGAPYLLTDTSHSYHQSTIYHGLERRDFEAVQLDTDGARFRFTDAARNPVMMPGEVVALTAMETGNYGAYLQRLIPKLVMLRQLGLMDRTILAPCAVWQPKVLEAFGVDLARVVPHDRNRCYRAERLIFPAMRSSEFFVDDATRLLFADLAAEVLYRRGRARGPELVYVSRITQGRKRPDYRLFMNEQALADALQARGFHIYEPEAHSFEDQVHTFASARVVVGPSGAGMFNTMFCRPGTLVVSLEPMLNWLALHANMFASFGHYYAMVMGGTDETDLSVQKRWRTDVDAVVGFVDRLAG